MLDLDYVRNAYSYDPDTGFLSYRKSAGCRKAGDFVGWVAEGYLKTKVNGKKISVHRLIWFLVYGELPVVVDRIDGNTHCHLSYSMSHRLKVSV